jgi:hypothetical protein
MVMVALWRMRSGSHESGRAVKPATIWLEEGNFVEKRDSHVQEQPVIMSHHKQ